MDEPDVERILWNPGIPGEGVAVMQLFHQRQILLGVTGSIAAYKAVELASRISQAGACIDVILTPAAQAFVSPLTFQSVTGRKAYTEADLWGAEGHVQHIGLAKRAELFMIAPATANSMAKLAHGQADNLLTVTALATNCPVMLAPAMDGGMFTHPATQANLEILRKRGVLILGPAQGHLASGLVGSGRMLEPAEILAQARLKLAEDGVLKGKHIVVTAGGTHEAIDPVRVLTNRSSGKQGFALAQAALDLGARVTLVSAPVSLETPVGAQRLDVQSAEEMRQAVMAVTSQADALLMAAAVADFRPAMIADQKIKKAGGFAAIELQPTVDILKAVSLRKQESGYPQVLVGFAAESRALIDNARQKLQTKNLDLIVANDISARDAGFTVDTNRVTLLFPDGRVQAQPLLSKAEVAVLVLEQVVKLLSDLEKN
jgi:phosphopantothenoylcysteine decarboxylase/phosphopantothenate--cysteine ligase